VGTGAGLVAGSRRGGGCEDGDAERAPRGSGAARGRAESLDEGILDEAASAGGGGIFAAAGATEGSAVADRGGVSCRTTTGVWPGATLPSTTTASEPSASSEAVAATTQRRFPCRMPAAICKLSVEEGSPLSEPSDNGAGGIAPIGRAIEGRGGAEGTDGTTALLLGGGADWNARIPLVAMAETFIARASSWLSASALAGR